MGHYSQVLTKVMDAGGGGDAHHALDAPSSSCYLTDVLSTWADDHLQATFAALADPTRRAILDRLTHGEATVLELAEPFDISLPAVSRHLKVLEGAGLISRGRVAQQRPCRLRQERFDELAQWTERYQRFWQSGFDRLGDYLESLQAPAGPAGDPAEEARRET